MTKEVTVRIEGRQLGEAGVWEEPIITAARGSYHELNDRYYIQYEEQTEDQELIRNMLKISLSRVEMMKKGAAVSQMSFDINDDTEAVYQTPYGNLRFEVRTAKLTVEESAGEIKVSLEYALSSEDTHISDNRTLIKITSV